jgi:ATP-dependent helicase HrpB
VYYDSTSKRVCAEEQLLFRDLNIGVRRLDQPPIEPAARLLTEEVLAGRLVLKQWDHTVDQWIVRLNLLSQWCPELGLPPLGEEGRRDLIEQICHGAASYKDIRDKPVKPVVKGWLSRVQEELLEKHMPERLTLSNGRTPKITYETGASPHIAIKIQELYGVTSIPKIGMGRVAIAIHILAPNMRPVQITGDLAGFWRDQYPRVKQELQRKYPKHEWR